MMLTKQLVTSLPSSGRLGGDTMPPPLSQWLTPCCENCAKKGSKMGGRSFVRMSLGVVWTVTLVLATLTLQGVKGQQFSPRENTKLNHLAVDPDTGTVYVGAVNHIYQLTSGLLEQNKVTTGPKLDHPFCVKFDETKDNCKYGSTTYEKSELDNYNKVLVFDTNTKKLITCGSVFQGTCEIRSASNITIADPIRSAEGTRYSQFVAANSEDGTTVAFTGPGPQGYAISDVLYVGTSFTSHRGTRLTVPLVSSRVLKSTRFDELLDYVHHDDIFETGTYHKWDNREPNVIDYKAGFSLDGFSYFFTVDESANGYNSRLISVCQDDSSYNSYVEMPLKCSDGSTDYNLIQSATVVKPGDELYNVLPSRSDYPYVIVAVFSRALDPDDKIASTASAVCVYDLSTVRDKIRENIKKCLETGKNCKYDITFEPTKDFCAPPSTLDNTYVYGDVALQTEPVIKYGDSILTAVTMDTVGTSTVAFIGTADGYLKKVTITSLTSAQEYSSVEVHKGHAIKGDMAFDENRKHLYVITEQKLFKVPVETCLSRKTCTSCRAGGDPYCGWCSLERRCSRQSECLEAQDDKRWLSNKAWDCIGIEWYTPQHTAIDRKVQVRFNIRALPILQGNENKYTCVFGDEEGPETIANSSGNDIICNTPTKNLIPAIPDKQDHVTVTLGIKSSETDTIFLQTNFSFYECGRHKKCSECTTSSWGCNWCVYDNKCVDEETTCTSGLSQPVVEDGQSNSCPRLEHPPEEQEILIPVGHSKVIRLSGSNLPEADPTAPYKCLLHVREPPMEIPATRVDDTTIECQANKYMYDEQQDTKTVNVAVVWGNNFYIEDDNTKAVTLYSCQVMGTDCSQCVSIMEHPKTRKYNCRWCNNQCSFGDTCNDFTTECPKPQILSVHPMKGPIEGGTLLTIEGSNLGRSFQQVERAVKVAGIVCVTEENLYEISKKIVCETGQSKEAVNGTVRVTLDDFTANFTQQKFSYQDPKLLDISPRKGPKAGGTRVTIKGTSLDAGAGDDISVTIGQVPCKIENITAVEIVCVTDRSTRVKEVTVQVKFGKIASRRLSSKIKFEYTANPNITAIDPLKTFVSGGRVLTISGSDLESIQRPQMIVTRQATAPTRRRRRQTSPPQKFITTCFHKDGDILCPSPNLLSPTNSSAASSSSSSNQCVGPSPTSPIPPGEYSMSFIMDGVSSVQEMADNFPWVDSTLTVVADPVYTVFEVPKEYKGDTLELKGTNLNDACTEKEVQVFIGDQQCSVKTLDKTSLFCDPPEEQPGEEGTYPLVVVRVGNTCHELGELKYQVVIVEGPPNDMWIIAVAVGGGCLIMIIIIILIVYKRKSRQAERQYKKMQMQLDTLESNVRNECKQAFAELQTEVSDFTSDINVIGIPFWDYKTYTFKVLFPSLLDHPVLHSQVTYNTNQFGSLQYNSTSKHGYDQGLHRFNQLLCSKQFILIFIRTLEQQKSFSIRDKAQVASLLMIVLQDKMEYATDILKALLNELIDRSVEKKHPKLMLRRTESVVEKLLTNWLSICMYGYLKKHAGKSLFMLYKAIKHQTEKGPIDAITAESRYSLSEDRLLREKIEPKTLNINLVTDEHREPVTCKMLDLDTITQAKEKALDAIYMNTPNTRRPKVHDVDLEWRSGRSGHLPLQDEDVTTEVIGGWKKVNTLAHYHVPDGATMALVQSRNAGDGVRNVNGMVEITSSLSAITPIMTMEEGTKVWHLVKHDDSLYMSRAQKVISEIFLTRLLATKGTLQQFIDDLFMTILRVDGAVPPAIKYLFDFLDQAARRHNIVDPDVVHTWKSNSLPLRFWVNIIKNPEFVFDVHKSHIVDSCLSVIAQTFMDACSTSEHRLGKDSPSNKLLFAKDIPRYRNWVSKFYRGIQEMAPVSEQEMQRCMTELSMSHIADFNVTVALRELYKYAQQYNFEFLENLDDDPSAKKLHLANKFEQVAAIIEGTPMY